MVINYRTHEISQGTRKLTQVLILIKKIYIFPIRYEISQGTRKLTQVLILIKKIYIFPIRSPFNIILILIFFHSYIYLCYQAQRNKLNLFIFMF